MSTLEVNGGVSRCGRVRKKTAKLMEMEENETTPNAVTERPIVRPDFTSPPSGRSTKKKPQKIRFTIGGEEVMSESSEVIEEECVSVYEPFECEEVVTEELIQTVTVPEPPLTITKTVPSLKIKLNPAKGTAELEDRVNSHSHKRKGSATNGIEASDRKRVRKSPAPKNTTDAPIATNHFNHSEHLLPNNTCNNHSNVHVTATSLPTAASASTTPAPTPVTQKPEAKVKQTNSAKSAKVPKSNADPTVKRTNVTAYTLWCKENRPKVQKEHPDMDFASVSRALGEIWQGLSNNEKLQWKLKADKIKNGPVLMRETGPTVTEPPTKNHLTPAAAPKTTSTPHQPVRRIVTSTAKSSSPRVARRPAASEAVILNRSGHLTPVDVASYLRVLGESLSSMGRRLIDRRPQEADSRSLTPLLDATLCAFGPLMALTSLDHRLDGCHPSTHSQTMDNISSLMPGI